MRNFQIESLFFPKLHMLTSISVSRRFLMDMRVFKAVVKAFFDTGKALSLEEPSAKPLKACFKDNGNKRFVVIKYQEFQFD